MRRLGGVLGQFGVVSERLRPILRRLGGALRRLGDVLSHFGAVFGLVKTLDFVAYIY